MDRLPDRLISLVIPVRDEPPEVVRALLDQLKVCHFPSFMREVIVVDDGSKTPCPYATIRHEINRGYGAALKSGITIARGELIATLDGDGQHTLYDIQRLLDFFIYFQPVDMVIGDRRLKDEGMRLVGRKGLNWTATLFAGRWIPDLNSGMRIFKRKIAVGYFPILSDRFSFTTSLTLSMLTDGYQVDWLPIKVLPRAYGESKVALWQDGWRTLKLIIYLGLALRTRALRQWLRPWVNKLRYAH